MKKIKLIMASKSEIFCRGLAKLIEGEPGIDIACVCGTGLEAVEGACKHQPDVAVIDTDLSECSGLEAMKRIHERLPDTGIIALSNGEKKADLISAIKAGSRAYISRNISIENLVKTIALVAGGKVVISPAMATGVLSAINLLEEHEQAIESGQNAILSEREKAVLHLIAQGFTNREVADRLLISENTIKIHTRNIMVKLHAHTREQAVFLAREERLLPGI